MTFEVVVGFVDTPFAIPVHNKASYANGPLGLVGEPAGGASQIFNIMKYLLLWQYEK
jgi:hypothetical protein